MNRREFLKSSLATGAAVALPRIASAYGRASIPGASTADAMILIWLPGGIPQTDTWDPKCHTPFRPGMRGCDLLGTCPIIPSSADGVSFGAGLEQLASVMYLGTVLRSLKNDAPFGDVHLKAQHYMMTGYAFPGGVRPPSMGAVVARVLGRRNARIPAYITIGRNVNNAGPEAAFINEYQGPGLYGPSFAPHVISNRAREDADFGANCLLARQFIEEGARFVQVKYPYEAFRGFDAHEHGARRTAEMKRRIDRPIAQLVRDLDERDMLRRTLVVVATEFGRTIAAGDCPSGEHLTIHHESQYGFHGHFSAASPMLFFGGGFKQGFAYGKTADRHPMVVVENPVRIEDVHATIYAALGIAPDTHYVHDGAPMYVTNGGKPIDALLA